MAAPVAAEVKVPDSTTTLGNVMNIAKGAQSLQLGRQTLESQDINLQKMRQANEERVRLQDFMSNPDNFETNGVIDMDKINKTVPQIAPLTGSDVMAKMATLSTAQTQANQAKVNLTQSQRGIVAGVLGVLGRSGQQNPASYISELDNLKTHFPNDKNFAQLVDAYKVHFGMAQAGPDVTKAAISDAQSILSPSEQQTALSPTATLTNTGGELTPTITQPSVAGTPPSVVASGPAVPLTLSPTTTKYNQTTKAMEYVGKEAGTGATAAAPPLGVPESAVAIASQVANDWTSVSATAKNASQDIGVLQEIKKYAPGAAAGVGSEKRAWLSGLAGLVGMDVAELTKTDTDLLAKNSNMLALAGGDTNLAKTLAETANPNIHMTPEAIVKAANQVIGQRQLSLARQEYLRPYVKKPDEYNKKAAEFNSIADPRVLQLPSLTPQEKIAMKNAMSHAEQKAFGEKVKQMQKLGILK